MLFLPGEVLWEFPLGDIGGLGITSHLEENHSSKWVSLLQIGFLSEFLFGKTTKEGGEDYTIKIKKGLDHGADFCFPNLLHENRSGHDSSEPHQKHRQQKKNIV